MLIKLCGHCIIYQVAYGRNLPLRERSVSHRRLLGKHPALLECQQNTVSFWIYLALYVDFAIDQAHDAVAELFLNNRLRRSSAPGMTGGIVASYHFDRISVNQ